MESDRARLGRHAGVTEPLRILMSALAQEQLAPSVAEVLGSQPHAIVAPGPKVDADIAFVSRDVTGLSTKHSVLPATGHFYDALLAAPSLRWVHVHSAGADRPVFVELLRRGVALSTSSGANAAVVAQTALAGVLALARDFPQLMAAQRARQWAPLIGSGMPRDLQGQTVVIVGWGPIGQRLGALLGALGLRIVVVRSSEASAGPGIETASYETLPSVLPSADWLVLACPLTDRTHQLLNADAMALLPAGARLVNVARGECVDEPALIDALRAGRLAGAFLDVFMHEPLDPGSVLWDLPNVIVTPHSAGFSHGNSARVAHMFLDNLAAWQAGRALHLQVSPDEA